MGLLTGDALKNMKMIGKKFELNHINTPLQLNDDEITFIR